MMFLALVILLCANSVKGFCGESIRWAHQFDVENVFGVWYGVGHAQHTPDRTDRPNEVGCVTLYITDVTNNLINPDDDWLDWPANRPSYPNERLKSYKSNPWSEPVSETWMDIREKRIAKRDMYTERRVRVIWDEDGQIMEQTYIYSTESPGLWILERWRPGEREMLSRGLDVWYPDDPPRHPEVIRILEVTPESLILNHCSELGDGGVFSLILRRSPETIEKWEWQDLRRKFYSFDLPRVYRYTAVCAGCVNSISTMYVLSFFVILRYLNKIFLL